MTLRDYIEAIASTQLFNGGQAQIVIALFKNAGAVLTVEEDTAKSWLRANDNKNRRIGRIKNYFPEDIVNENGFIEFIRSRTEHSWAQLQKAFHSISEADSLVNLATDDPEIFYWSLLNQFQKIHRLPLSEMPAKKMVRLFKNAIEKCEIFIFFEDAANFSDEADISGRIAEFLSTVNADIIDPFKSGHSESSMYQKILELHRELESFVILHQSAISNLMSYHRSYHDNISCCRQRIDTLYCEICGIRPQYESLTLGSFSFKIED